MTFKKIIALLEVQLLGHLQVNNVFMRGRKYKTVSYNMISVEHYIVNLYTILYCIKMMKFKLTLSEL